jgi:hypothetical protein
MFLEISTIIIIMIIIYNYEITQLAEFQILCIKCLKNYCYQYILTEYNFIFMSSAKKHTHNSKESKVI